jgi:hypothetical protein
MTMRQHEPRHRQEARRAARREGDDYLAGLAVEKAQKALADAPILAEIREIELELEARLNGTLDLEAESALQQLRDFEIEWEWDREEGTYESYE